MQVFRRFLHNNLRNYNYLLVCRDTQQAIALDPLDADALYQLAQAEGVDIKLIINTHEHHDHVEGNLPLQALTQAPIWAHERGLGKIPGQSRGLLGGDLIELGSMRLQVLFTPGHTLAHLCLFAPEQAGQSAALFSGDTLFNASAGNCHKGGDVDLMYDSFTEQLAKLPDNTLLYPGHDYLINNLRFALSVDARNERAQYWLERLQNIAADDLPVMTLGQEREYNPFLRLEKPSIWQHLQQQFPTLSLNEREVFRALRQLRNHW